MELLRVRSLAVARTAEGGNTGEAVEQRRITSRDAIDEASEQRGIELNSEQQSTQLDAGGCTR